MADDEGPAVGTVAQEAARLLDALGGWASSAQAGYAARPAPSPASPDEAGPDEAGPDEADPDEAGPDEAGPDRAPGEGGADRDPFDGHAHRCESCGAENGMGQAVTCQLCPVCQGIGLLRSVRPETVDRLAELAAALAATLRDIAGQRRADAGAAPSRRSSSQAARGRVQDITVDDEDDDAAHADEVEHPGSATS